MSDENEGGPQFQVNVEDCERWMNRLTKMARSLEKKDGADHTDSIRMFYTAAVMVQKLGLEIQEDTMFHSASANNPFGTDIGEA